MLQDPGVVNPHHLASHAVLLRLISAAQLAAPGVVVDTPVISGEVVSVCGRIEAIKKRTSDLQCQPLE
jgi:hypothetical protein